MIDSMKSGKHKALPLQKKYPFVSLALPLYKSRRFLDIILENLNTLEYPNLEILISDRHCADDAIDILQARFGSDARFHFFRARDEINYVEHFNFLLRAATGEYFFWLMHDDSYPSNYITALADALDENPNAILAYGGLEMLRHDGSREMFESRNFTNADAWNTREIFRRFLAGHLILAVRGMYRLESAKQRGFIQPTRDLFAADFLWTFAQAFTGRWCFVPTLTVKKRIYPTSALGHWRTHTARHTLAEVKALHLYLVNHAPNVREKIRACGVIVLWMLLRLGGDALYGMRLHQHLHKPIQKFILPRLGI